MCIAVARMQWRVVQFTEPSTVTQLSVEFRVLNKKDRLTRVYADREEDWTCTEKSEGSHEATEERAYTEVVLNRIYERCRRQGK